MAHAHRIAVIGSAVPHEKGPPAQREAAAFRQSLRAFSDVHWFVVDAEGSQIKSRSVLQTGVSLFPLWKPKANGTSCLSPGPDGRGPGNVGMHGDPGGSILPRLMGRRRFDRLVARILAIKPDLLVIDDPIFASLASYFLVRKLPLVLADRNLGGIHDALSYEARTLPEIRQHGIYAKQIRDAQDLATGAFDQVWQSGLSLRPPHATASNVVRVPRSALGREDARLCEKQASVVVAATGINWLDKIIADKLREPLTALVARSAGPEVFLLGFDRQTAGFLDRQATLDDDWANFELRVVQARYLLVAAAAPGVGELIQTALILGTPVLCPRSVARLHGVDGLTGVFTYDRTTPMLDLLELGTLPSEEEAQAYAGIAAAAAKAFGLAACRNATERALTDILGRTRPVVRAGEAATRHMKVTPFAAAPMVSFHSGTRLLLVHVKLRKSVGASEIRILDSRGVEATRILVNVDPSPGHVQIVEGGTVLEAGIEPGDITVDLYDRDTWLAGQPVPADRIAWLEGELAALLITDVVLEGVFWSTPKEGQQGWTIEHAGHQTRVLAGQAMPMRGLNLSAVPFKLIRTRASVPGSALEIKRIEGAERRSGPMIQRPALLSRLMAAPEGGLAQIEAFKDIHRGRRAWMLGNGPSVRHADLDAIPDGDVTFAFNRFYKSYADTRLREDYVVSADTLMIADFGQEMIDISSGMAIFCHNRLLSELSGRFVTLTPLDSFLPLFSYDAARFVSVGGSSVFIALQMAFYMGIREVFLYGMDFSFTMNLVRDPRFRFPVSFDDCNHFIKDYRSSKPWCPPNWRDITAGFVNARAAFEINGGRILNATRGGKLEIFERIDFSEAVGERAPQSLAG